MLSYVISSDLFGLFFFLRIRRPTKSTLSSSSAASDVYKRQHGAAGNLSAKLPSPAKINTSKLTSYENKGLLKKLIQNAQTVLQQPSLDYFVKKMVHANVVSQKIFEKKKVQFEQSLQSLDSPEKLSSDKKSPRRSAGISIAKKKKKNEKKLGNKSEL
eukprot:TRINITY_DN31396_c0_g1_i1.p2 TRINITY_DN31396_c0_g1~~TRINITY_DN31396_c0_g1_i1.p2  ORF type:complete len:158 (+),score=41.55 TRINITY_DN31396_c0_g1_i1:3-476(+)